MTGSKALIDTNIINEVFDGNKIIAEKIHQLNEVYISTIVLGELFVGINRVINKAKHLKQLRDLLRLCTVLECNSQTAEIYGDLTAALFKKGKPIPTNDVWIAACAKQHGLKIITRDKHFNEIPDVELENGNRLPYPMHKEDIFKCT